MNAIAMIKNLPAQRAESASRLASALTRLVAQAKDAYAPIVANPSNMNADTQNKMRVVADQTEALKAELQKCKEQASADLLRQLKEVEQASVSRRWLLLVVFFITLAVSGVLVHFTIRRSITGPIVRVIDGITRASAQATDASGQMAQSGQVVGGGLLEVITGRLGGEKPKPKKKPKTTKKTKPKPKKESKTKPKKAKPKTKPKPKKESKAKPKTKPKPKKVSKPKPKPKSKPKSKS